MSSAICLALSVNAYAADQIYTAPATGSDGSSGTVSFTIDSGIAAAGSSIYDGVGTVCGAGAPNLKAFSLTMTGGSVPSGSQTWTCAHVSQFNCNGSVGATTPCGNDLNFSANNGTASFTGSMPNQATASWAGANITWGAVSAAAPPVSAPLFNFNKSAVTYGTEVIGTE